MIIRYVCVSVMVLTLVACAGSKSQSKPVLNAALGSVLAPELIAAQKISAQSALEQRQRSMAEFLANAQQSLAEGDLMVPAFNNAFYWYRQVLMVDNTCEDAHLGMRAITDRLMLLAKNAFIDGDDDRAELMLSRALKVSATPAHVNFLRKRYKHDKIASNEYRLSVMDLSARNNKLLAQLDELAKMALAKRSRLLIVARNDAEGRWIYKQMRSAVNGQRLRGNIKIGSKPAIVLIDVDV